MSLVTWKLNRLYHNYNSSIHTLIGALVFVSIVLFLGYGVYNVVEEFNNIEYSENSDDLNTAVGEVFAPFSGTMFMVFGFVMFLSLIHLIIKYIMGIGFD